MCSRPGPLFSSKPVSTLAALAPGRSFCNCFGRGKCSVGTQICNHCILGRVRILRVLNPGAWEDGIRRVSVCPLGFKLRVLSLGVAGLLGLRAFGFLASGVLTRGFWVCMGESLMRPCSFFYSEWSQTLRRDILDLPSRSWAAMALALWDAGLGPPVTHRTSRPTSWQRLKTSRTYLGCSRLQPSAVFQDRINARSLSLNACKP